MSNGGKVLIAGYWAATDELEGEAIRVKEENRVLGK